MTTLRQVALFDVDLPPGVAFLRSLARAGVPLTVFGSSRRHAGRYSRYTTEFRSCPPVQRIDEFTEWLTDEMRRGDVDLVAPTSDFVVYNAMQATIRAGTGRPTGLATGMGTPQALRDCLFKHRFVQAMADAGLPAPPTAAPTTVDGALEAAEQFGYPVALKPRTHVGIGQTRGSVVHSARELRREFRPYVVHSHSSGLMDGEPDLAMPLVQAYLGGAHDVVSVSGCLDADGDLLAACHSRKLRQWPGPLGVGTLFEALPAQPFSERAIDAVRAVLGRGLFELELMVSRATGEAWPIDLNPRAYGQVSLAIAHGWDLPRLWYSSVCDAPLATSTVRISRPRYWRYGVPYYVESVADIVRGPARRTGVADLLGHTARPRVGAMFEWSDPAPAVAFALHSLRHPTGLLRPYVGERAEPTLSGRPGSPAVTGSPTGDQLVGDVATSSRP